MMQSLLELLRMSSVPLGAVTSTSCFAANGKTLLSDSQPSCHKRIPWRITRSTLVSDPPPKGHASHGRPEHRTLKCPVILPRHISLSRRTYSASARAWCQVVGAASRRSCASRGAWAVPGCSGASAQALRQSRLWRRPRYVVIRMPSGPEVVTAPTRLCPRVIGQGPAPPAPSRPPPGPIPCNARRTNNPTLTSTVAATLMTPSSETRHSRREHR